MRSRSVDANQAQIADALRRIGWDVIDTHGCAQDIPGFPDLIAIRRGVVLPIEIKAPGGRLTLAERAFATAHPEWKPWIVRSVDDALALVGAEEGAV